MGFRFFKRIKIIPGVTVNVSKSGMSTSLGVKGAHVTLGGVRGTRTTVGIPGTGLSYTETLKDQPAAPQPSRGPGVFVLILLALGAVALFMVAQAMLGI